MRSTILALMCTLALASSAAAQSRTQTQTTTQSTTRTTGLPAPAPPAPPPAPPSPAASVTNGQPVNVKMEFTLTDQRGAEPAVKRVITVIASDRNPGRVRSVAYAQITGETNREIPLNVDATPTVLGDSKIRLQFTLAYDLPVAADFSNATNSGYRITRTDLQDSITLVLTDGKPMIAAQSADPIGDRKVTVEVTATVLK